MFNKKSIFGFFVVWLLSAFALFGQDFPRGAILDEELYNSLPQKAEIQSRASTPKSHSLKQYAPQPGDQGNYSTCTGWASAYAARTISESIALNRRDAPSTTNNVFSPIFAYKGGFTVFNLANGNDGAAIPHVLDFMKKEGAVKRLSIEKTADFKAITISMFANSKRYPISDYVRLYSSSKMADNDNTKTERVKRSLLEGKPVIIGMNSPDSFNKAKDVWRPSDNPTIDYGGHAMCVVGYDDTKDGGAFEILNSWGTNWGNKGYIWIPYKVFNQFVFEAYEMIEDLKLYKDGAEYEGSVNIIIRDSNKGIPVRFDDGYYKTTDSYESGTRFRYLIGNKKPAYVYAFAADSATKETTQIFPPPNTNISPVLDYSENVVALPGESWWMRLNEITGTDYLVVLYSKEALDIDAIRTRFSSAKGTFPERVANAVGSNYMSALQIKFEQTKMQFTAKSGNSKAVFGLLLAIDHK